MAKSKHGAVVSDGSENLLIDLVERFSVKRAVEWLRIKFPSFDTSRGEELSCDATKNEREYFAAAELLGYVTRLPQGGTCSVASADDNKPLLVAAVKMRKDLTERTSRLVQFNYAKKLLQNAITKGAQGVSGLPSQGLFFYYDQDGFFRLSLVTGEVEKRRFKYNEAKRQSFYIEPLAANNIVKRRLTPPIKTFADLKDVFSVEQLTKEFYTKLFDWYTWAMSSKANVSFPNDLDDDTDDRKYNNEAIIRLITRLMFTWFIRQRKLVPDILFDRAGLKDILKRFDATSMEQDNYYRAILQNLFFATFNCPQTGKGKLARRWIDADVNASGNGVGLSSDYRITTVYRYRNEFKDPDAFLKLMKKVPFLNCALFDCLDKVKREVDGGRKLYFDGFSTKKKRQAFVPNGLFFDDARGIINLFNRYEFTVNENNADDSDVALDPELLGKVFENLLGAFNPETQETARNATGSFYTPREIVDYMVEESLKNYLKERLSADGTADAKTRIGEQKLNDGLNDLFDRNKAAEGAETLFSAKEREAILSALYTCKILDPACGSGAFPMGILHCMVRLLTRLDPQCVSIREHLLARYREDKALVDPTETAGERKERLEELESRLKEGQHYPDYERKLYLIENCIYGVDIQPIATQISKLRFFISLLCDQLRSSYDPDAENFGLLSLPNLEAKFVCANTLISLPDLKQELPWDDVAELRTALQANRHKIFRARSTTTKEKYKAKDLEIRDAIRATVRDSLAKPDEEVIAKCREQIADAKKRRETVSEPDWYEEDVQVQTDLFAPFEKKRVRKDRNEAKRRQIDAKIDWEVKKIKEELKKADKANVLAATRYADMVAGWDPYDQNASSPFFDPEWMLNNQDGFDVVIGNPPYVRRTDLAECDKAQYEKLFFSAKGQYDLYLLFTERGLQFLKEDGDLTFINPIRFFNAEYGRKAREYIAKNFQICSILDVSQLDVFQSALTYPCVLHYRKIKGDVLGSNRIAYRRLDDLGMLLHMSSVGVTWLSQGDILTDEEYRIITSSFETREIIRKVNSCGYEIGNVFSVARGLPNKDVDLRKDAFVALKSKGVLRYSIDGSYVIRVGTKCSEGFAPEMLIMPRTVRSIRATMKPRRMVLLDRIYYLEAFQKVDLRFALGVINSQITNYWFEDTYATTKVAGGYFDLNGNQIKSIRLPKCNESDEKVISTIVGDILSAKKMDPEVDTTELESQIDQLVYKLYGLTEEEIAIVEGRGGGRGATALSDDGHAGRVTLPGRRARGRSAVEPVREADDEELE